MERREFITNSMVAPLATSLIAGGGFNTAFIRYMAEITGKPRPKLLYLPIASADSQSGVIIRQPGKRESRREGDGARTHMTFRSVCLAACVVLFGSAAHADMVKLVVEKREAFANQAIGEWVASGGRGYAVADLRLLPDEVRRNVQFIKEFGQAAVIRRPGGTINGCDFR